MRRAKWKNVSYKLKPPRDDIQASGYKTQAENMVIFACATENFKHPTAIPDPRKGKIHRSLTSCINAALELTGLDSIRQLQNEAYRASI